MVQSIRTEIVATNKPVGQFQFEIRKIANGRNGSVLSQFHSSYYSMEHAVAAKKKLDKKLFK